MNASHYGRHDWRTQAEQDQRYALLAALYYGNWRVERQSARSSTPESLFPNSREIVKTTNAIVDFYEQLIWQGDLSTDGKPLPDGTRGAIPIDPQTGSESTDDQLLRAFSELFKMWQWRAQMSLIPKTAAIFGDVLVELRDFPLRGMVLPDIIYPGYVPDADLELDLAGNVQRYAVEYPVAIAASTAFGEDIQAESYTFRKEVDGETFRFYKDGKPFDYPDIGPAVQDNPYGFAPACLFRHELVVSSNRGIGAYEKSVLQMNDINSTLSAAIDYQRRNFGAPIGVKGSVLRAGRTVSMGGLTISAGTTEADVERARLASAENMNLLPLSDNGEFVTIPSDIGQTMEMVKFNYDLLIAENAEATLSSKLFSLTQATGPGMQRLLSPIIGKIETVRKIQDTQMVKLLQIGTTVMGFRLHAGDIPERIIASRSDRFKAFAPYDLDSYGRGLEDATIPKRDVFPESKAEKAQWLAIAADLPPWGLRELGVSEEDIAAMEEEKQAARDQMAAALSVAGAGNEGEAPAEEEPVANGRVAEAVA